MFRFITPLIATVFLTFNPAIAGEWAKYEQIAKKYYYLDSQNFEQISCQVRAPALESDVLQAKETLINKRKHIEIKDDFSNFRLIYSPKNGVQIHRPSFRVKLLNTDGVADPVKLKADIDKLHNAFKQQVDGLETLITALFNYYYYPEQENYSNLVVLDNSEKKRVKYENKEWKVIETHFDNVATVKMENTVDKRMVTSKQTYQSTHGKLLMQRSLDIFKYPSRTQIHDTSFDYQSVGKVLFPKQFKTTVTLKERTITQQMEINFEKCRID